jgi:hypothetical protein
MQQAETQQEAALIICFASTLCWLTVRTSEDQASEYSKKVPSGSGSEDAGAGHCEAL